MMEKQIELRQQERKEPFQIMCDSTEKNLIDFIETAGFVCKRKCYACEAKKEDLKAELQSEVSMVLTKYPENELAYVGSISKELYKNFIEAVAARLFEKHDTICFECDNTDWEAMQLKELFAIADDESYNTYILERTTK